MKPVVPIVLAGAVKPLPGDERLSGIDKHLAAGPWTISSTGLVDDAQADLPLRLFPASSPARW